MKMPIDTGFIHDISQLDKLRQQAASSENADDALRAAAEQFEAIFTQMLFKSMRQANEAFESDLVDNRTSKFFQQMADEQLSSTLSQQGSLGLADLIVQQFKGINNDVVDTTNNLENKRPKLNILSPPELIKKQAAVLSDKDPQLKASFDSRAKDQVKTPPISFNSPSEFVTNLAPYAKKAARLLGVDPAILIAQAALETGWGEKVIANARGSSHNLFNIKADPRWQGEKLAVQTLEYHQDIPVQEKASFRAYSSFEDSFDDYVQFLNKNPRYANALEQSKTPSQFIKGLHDAGYATDPNYADKVMSVFKRVKGLME